MARNEFTFPSADGKTQIHSVEWLPDGEVRAVLQIAHGVSEYILRYEPFANYLTAPIVLNFSGCTVEMEGHTAAVDEAVMPDCLHTGLTEGSHCSVCKKILVVNKFG